MFRVQLDLPNHSKGQEVELEGVGIFKNGETHMIDNKKVAIFNRVEGITITKVKASETKDEEK